MKTVNLELSKQLKAKGYPQDQSDFGYDDWRPEGGVQFLYFEKSNRNQDGVEWIASPTCDEILEQLPAQIQDGELYGLEIQKSPNFYLAQYYDNYGKHSLVSRSAKELSDLLAIMWLYLKENNLLEVEG